MKFVALVLSTASLLLFAAPNAAAQAAPPAEGPPPPTSAGAPVEAAAPTTPPNPAPVASQPAADPSTPASPPARPTAPNPQYPPYGYGYPYPYGPGWGAPSQLPEELPYTSGGPIPKGYKLEERYSYGLLIAGPTLFALGYALSAFTAAEKLSDSPPSINGGLIDRTPWGTLYIPIAGPFAFSGYAPQGSAFIYVFEGIAQVTGVGLLLGGILRPKEMLVKDKDAEAAFQPTLRVGPRSMQLEMHF
jgi:hypothetical protein